VDKTSRSRRVVEEARLGKGWLSGLSLVLRDWSGRQSSVPILECSRRPWSLHRLPQRIHVGRV